MTIVEAVGSVPQDAGARMLVTAGGLHTGTVGGGKVEGKAIAEAQAMLGAASGAPATQCLAWNLKRDVGMTCGGTVRLYFEAFGVAPWQIVVFGAGHVANALARLLVGLDCRITVLDPRPEWLARLPESPRLARVLADDMPAQVAALPEDAFVLLMTMGHTTDRPILLEILRTRTFPYLGVIGSAAKAARLRKDVTEAGLPAAAARRLLLPHRPAAGHEPPRRDRHQRRGAAVAGARPVAPARPRCHPPGRGLAAVGTRKALHQIRPKGTGMPAGSWMMDDNMARRQTWACSLTMIDDP